MKKNIGSTDKTIRLVVAALIAVLYFTGTVTGTIAIVLGIVALILVVTSIVNFCPIYSLIGTNSCKTK
jgi:glucose uptake protein GlcU